MAVQRNQRRPDIDGSNLEGLIVAATPDGHLEWLMPAVPETQSEAGQHPVAQPAAADVLSAEEQALIAENRKKLDEIRHQRVGSPDLEDIVRDIMARTDYGVDLAAAIWLLAGIGVLPGPAMIAVGIAADTAIDAGKYVVHRLHHSDLAQTQADGQVNELWKSHPGIAMSIFSTVMANVVDSIVQAASIDDTQLEDQLDHYYPRWSQTDFEFDPRRIGGRLPSPKE